MKKRLPLALAAACLLAGAWAWLAPSHPSFESASSAATPVSRMPSIYPDYSDVTIPPNIAPLNFSVQEPGTEWVVRIHAAHGEAIHAHTRNSRVIIPLRSWRRLLDVNRGEPLTIDVCVRDAEGAWKQFRPIVNTIAESEIDSYLFYRLIRPIHTGYREVNIFQRDVRNYDETPLVENRSFGKACVNCHTFAPNQPDRMILQTRGSTDGITYSGTVVLKEGEFKKVDTRVLAKSSGADMGRVGKSMAVYSAWHPNGELLIYSANNISQSFHAVGDVRDVFDSESDLALYHVDSERVSTTPEIARPDRLETFPTWSPDGRTLYFCAADVKSQEEYNQVRYDLMRIAYDPDTDQWGELEKALSSTETGLSITEPRVSPDGKWVLFCMSDYGSFPVYQESSDLYLLNLETGDHHRLAVNSPLSDSWHCWSSNGRWIAFASKRMDGLLGRVYFSYLDESGKAHKAMVLPQEDPLFYDGFLKTYNAPELTRWPAPMNSRALGRAIRHAGQKSEKGAKSGMSSGESNSMMSPLP